MSQLTLAFVWQIRCRFRAEAAKFRAEAAKLWAEGAKLWAEAILEVHGNITLQCLRVWAPCGSSDYCWDSSAPGDARGL